MAGFLAALPSFLPNGESGWVYYVVCALFFTLSGLACGYFIWRRGFMQTLDAELEVKKTAEELSALRDDLNLEEKEIRPEVTAEDPVSTLEENPEPEAERIEEKPSTVSDGLFD